MAATQCVQVLKCDRDDLVNFKPSIRIGKKGDFSDFECGMVFDMSQADLTISEIFVPTYPSLWFTENC